MKKRPLVIHILVAASLFFPLFMILQVILVREVGLGEAIRQFAWTQAPILAPWEYLFATALAWFMAYAVYQVKRWSWWIAVVVCAGLVFHNLYVILYRVVDMTDVRVWTLAVITIAPAVAITLLVRREVRAPFFNPRIRWWEQDPRYPIDVPLEGGGRVLDISRTGMFVTRDPLPEKGDRAAYAFEVEGIRMEAEAEVIWVSTGDSTHPGGVGLRFVDASDTLRSALERVLERQRQLGRKQWQRRTPRYPTDIRCGDDDVVLDLSAGGMFVESATAKKVGERGAFHLTRGSHDLQVSGEVVWVSDGSGGRPQGFGVRFAALPESEHAKLGGLLAELRKEAGSNRAD